MLLIKTTVCESSARCDGAASTGEHLFFVTALEQRGLCPVRNS